MRYVVLGTTFGVLGFVLLVGGAFVLLFSGWPGAGLLIMSPAALWISRLYWDRWESKRPGG